MPLTRARWLEKIRKTCPSKEDAGQIYRCLLQSCAGPTRHSPCEYGTCPRNDVENI